MVMDVLWFAWSEKEVTEVEEGGEGGGEGGGGGSERDEGFCHSQVLCTTCDFAHCPDCAKIKQLEEKCQNARKAADSASSLKGCSFKEVCPELVVIMISD